MDIPGSATAQLTGLFLSPAVLMLAASIYLVLLSIGKVFPKLIDNAYYNRVLPILPECLGVVVTFFHAYKVPPEFQPWIMQHAVVGVWIGMLASKAYKVVDQSLLGKDEAIKKVP